MEHMEDRSQGRLLPLDTNGKKHHKQRRLRMCLFWDDHAKSGMPVHRFRNRAGTGRVGVGPMTFYLIHRESHGRMEHI